MDSTARGRTIQLVQKAFDHRADIQTALAPVIATLYRTFPDEHAVRDLFKWHTQIHRHAYGYAELEPVLRDLLEDSARIDGNVRTRTVRLVQMAIGDRPDLQTALIPVIDALHDVFPQDTAISELHRFQQLRVRQTGTFQPRRFHT